eukprot:933525-Rhodomonas_salina.1
MAIRRCNESAQHTEMNRCEFRWSAHHVLVQGLSSCRGVSEPSFCLCSLPGTPGPASLLDNLKFKFKLHFEVRKSDQITFDRFEFDHDRIPGY